MSLYTENQLSLKSMVADFMKKEVVPDVYKRQFLQC